MATYDITQTTVDVRTLSPGDILYCPYTGDIVSIELPLGTYKFEAYGAQGGGNDPFSTTKGDRGGAGGYTKAIGTLPQDTMIYIQVGQAGFYGAGSSPYGGPGVSYNGGGSGGNSASGSGGGATDFRLTGGAWNDTLSLYSRILVAGGGGGADNSGSSRGGSDDGSGGHGGGLVSENPYIDGRLQSGYEAGQTYGNALGVGQNVSNNTDTGGAGGGYWGGKVTNHNNGGGAGGSSYISRWEGCDTTYLQYQGNIVFTEGELVQGNHTGNGVAYITIMEIPPQGTPYWFSRSNLEPKLISAEITTPPTKVDYAVGEVFDPTGMVATFTYDDDSTKTVSSWTHFYPFTVDWDMRPTPIYFYEKEYNAMDYINIGCRSYYDPGYYRIDVWTNGKSRGTYAATTKANVAGQTPAHTGLRLLSNMSGANWTNDEPWGSPTDYYYAMTTIYLYAPEAYDVSVTWYTDDQGSIYLNDTQLQTFGTCVKTTRTLNFVQGMNKLEIFWWEETGISACYFTNWHPETDTHFTYVGPYPKITSSERISTIWA